MFEKFLSVTQLIREDYFVLLNFHKDSICVDILNSQIVILASMFLVIILPSVRHLDPKMPDAYA